MNERPKVSVLTITYNHEQFIAQCVESALSQQTSFPFEIVIGEDCSTDNTRAVVRGLANNNRDRIQLLSRDENVGMGRNFVDAYNSCRGEFIALLDGDDYWTDPLKLQKQVSALEANLSWSGCYHSVSVVDRNGRAIGEAPPIPLQKHCTFETLCDGNVIPTCSAMLRRCALPDLPEWHATFMPGDWPLFLLVARFGAWGYIDEPMASYRVHQAGIWSGRQPVAQVLSVIDMLEKLEEQLEPRWRSVVRNARQRFIGDHIRNLHDQIDRSLALKIARWIGRAVGR